MKKVLLLNARVALIFVVSIAVVSLMFGSLYLLKIDVFEYNASIRDISTVGTFGVVASLVSRLIKESYFLKFV